MITNIVRLRAVGMAALALFACSKPERAASGEVAGARPMATASAAPSVTATADSSTLLAKADRGRIRGDSSAKVWLVIVSDFQCPYCRQWHDEVFATVVRDYVDTKKLRIAYVNLPLQSHANAIPSAQAAMCASVQGRFWEMHDALFRTQARWAGMATPQPLFDSLATSVGVEAAPFRSCIESKATEPMIAADARRVSDAGVQATPTFFIGDERIEGAVPLAELRAAVDRALAKANSAR
jgi:protein-disulfide isomerase